MKAVIRWAINNGPAMNTLMIAVLVVGAVSLMRMRREVFPEFELEILLVTVPYPGASPSEVEQGICQKIEEAVTSVAGIEKKTSVAKEGAGFLVLELEASTKDVQKVLSEVRSEIDRIPSFPELAEDPEVKQITFRVPAIRVGVIGPDVATEAAEARLREVAEEVRDDLLKLPPAPPKNPVMRVVNALFPKPKQSAVSQANIVAARDYQIDVEIPEQTLRKHGLTLRQVAGIVRRENLELPGGSMKTDTQEVLLRGKNKRLLGEEIARIPIITRPDGEVLTINDLGQVRDHFADSTSISRINGKPGLAISVDRTTSEDLLAMVAAVRGYLDTKEMPPGYSLTIWNDGSVDVQDRLETLLRNGVQGLLLVFFVLAVFLDLRLAFWVALGIPIAVLGAGAVLLMTGQTLNMLSMFAFLMALGIVVDDAIVIGENIYKHREMGKKLVRAAIDGTLEVLPSVAASVCTTIIAFVPLMFVTGVMGKFIAVMPVAVIAMLVISLIESTFILPCHLGHRDGLFFKVIGFLLYPVRFIGHLFAWINQKAGVGMDFTIERIYLPTLRWGLRNPVAVIAVAVGMMLVSVGFVRSGITPFVVFPKLDTRAIEASVTFADGTPAAITRETVQRLETAIQQVDRRMAPPGESLITLRHLLVGQMSQAGGLGPASNSEGSNVGSVSVELVPADEREVTSDQLMAAWREAYNELAGDLPQPESLTFRGSSMGPGGTPIEFKLLAPSDADGIRQLEAAVERCKRKLASYEGVFDVEDDSRPGKWEYQLRVKDRAVAMGIPLAELAETVRASYYGEEVMRLQRGRHEVKLMVRYPPNERRSLAAFEDIHVRSDDGVERPLTQLADVQVKRGYAEINRVDQMRAITVSADVDRAKGGNAFQTVADMRETFVPELLQEYPAVGVRWEGQQETTQESMLSLFVGFLIAALGMYVLLTIEFRSYAQPILILAIIPFGVIGAIFGHAAMGLDFTLFSVFGMIALTGVVINDSIVLVDFINQRVAHGDSAREALIQAGRRRFRPVFLTSITTVAGLTPLLLEQSFQAQVLIPMATSLSFGLMLATLLVLLLVPVFYMLYYYLIVGHVDMPNKVSRDDDFDDIPPVVRPAAIDAAVANALPATEK